jgi:predicted nucleic acid-binding protein
MSSGNHTQLCFIDTNVWLYAFIQSQDQNKSAKAQVLIQQSDIIISSQVVNEVCVNLIKKAHLDERSIRKLINAFYNNWCNVLDVDKNTLLKASKLREEFQFSFWDSLIVSSAILGGAETLYTEDMSDGLLIEGSLTITNPFTL